MLTNTSKALLERLEAKYINMLGMIIDIANINMEDSPERVDLEKFILSQQQAIHEAASRLKCCK